MVDTSVVLPACLAGGLRFSGRWRWLAPALLWSEVLSALHEATWRGDLTPAEAASARAVFAQLPVSREEPPLLADQAWVIADELGLAKTYDAEFLALAQIHRTLVVTADAQLRRVAGRLGLVVDPVELEAFGRG